MRLDYHVVVILGAYEMLGDPYLHAEAEQILLLPDGHIVWRELFCDIIPFRELGTAMESLPYRQRQERLLLSGVEC